MDLSLVGPELAQLLGIPQSTMLLLLIVVPTIANAVSKAIPSDSTGVLGFVRRLTKIVGVNVSNRVTSVNGKGVTTTDVAKATLKVSERVGEVIELEKLVKRS